MSLSGKTAVITGSNSGIGLGIAWELARAGANVVLNSFTDNEEDHALAEEEIAAMKAFAAQEPIGIVSLYIRTAELVLWPSSDQDRRSHAEVVRAAGLEDCALILLRPDQSYVRP